MCVQYLGFALVWFLGVLHALGAPHACDPPELNGGYFFPEQETYAHETTLTYACDYGLKPATEVWWATSTCAQNGQWSPEPQCIDENACIPPTIPNGKYTESQNVWHEQGDKIRITCNEGYEHKNRDATAECINGTWSSVPVCEKSNQTCGEPPKIPHAVIIYQEYKEVFASDSKVQYECQHGYTVVGGENKKFIFCIAGRWSEGPTCHREARPGSGQGGSTVGGSDGGSASSAGSGTQPASAGSSTVSVLNEREIEPVKTTVTRCGKPPAVANGDVVVTDLMFLKYRCSTFYKRVGPEKVWCHSDGTWSEVPTCKDAFCSVDTGAYTELKSVGVKFIKDGESVRLECNQEEWWFDNFSVARCTNGRLRLSRCCNWFQLKSKLC